jgi:hypothetical protein
MVSQVHLDLSGVGETIATALKDAHKAARCSHDIADLVSKSVCSQVLPLLEQQVRDTIEGVVANAVAKELSEIVARTAKQDSAIKKLGADFASEKEDLAGSKAMLRMDLDQLETALKSMGYGIASLQAEVVQIQATGKSTKDKTPKLTKETWSTKSDRPSASKAAQGAMISKIISKF